MKLPIFFYVLLTFELRNFRDLEIIFSFCLVSPQSIILN